MKKRVKYFLISLFVVLLFFAILFVIFSEEKECVSDADCFKVQATCCSCNMGGEEMCVPFFEKEFYENQLLNCSGRTICAAFDNCKIKSCGCVRGKCQG